MKNIAIGCVAAVILVGVIGVVSYMRGYNSMVRLDQDCKTKWAQVDVQLKRRYDLIPNLVDAVKGYMRHEKAVFTAIAEARKQYAGAGNVNEKVNAANNMESALARLLVVVERYPDLKASEQFTGLRDELAGTENRIAVARGDFNNAVQGYNTYILSIPTRFYAGMAGFKERAQFKAPEAEKEAPRTNFTSK